MKILDFKKNKCLILSLIVMQIFYLWIAHRIPYAHDDWDWGLQEGIRHYFAADYDSRYAGNLVEIIITRSPVLKTILMSLTFTMIPLAASRTAAGAAGRNTSPNSDLMQTGFFLFGSLMFLLLPREIWRQTNGWIAAFSNYTISGFLLLIYYLILLHNETSENSEKSRPRAGAGYLFFGVLIQLFLENLTLYFVVFSVFFLLIHRNHPLKYRLLPLLSGTLLGTVIMFSSNIYPTLIRTGYEKVAVRHLTYMPGQPFHYFILECARRFLRDFIPQLVSCNSFLMGSIAALMATALISDACKKDLFRGLGGISTGFSIYYYLGKRPASRPLLTAIDCFFIVLVFAEILLLFRREPRQMFWLLVLWISPCIIVSPMLVVSSAPPRVFYSPYICYMVFALLLLYLQAPRVPRICAAVLYILLVLALLKTGAHWTGIYGPIGQHIREREQRIETAVLNGSSQIIFSKFPHSDYLWYQDPIQKKPWWTARFKRFYHIPENIDIWFESWKPVR